MAILKAAEVRSMAREDRLLRLQELREELMNERGVAAMGGSPPSPGKIRQLRTAIARIHTINRLEELGRPGFSRREVESGQAARAKRQAQAPAKKKAPAKKAAAKKKATKKAAKKAASSSKPATASAKKKTSGGKTGGNE